MEQCKKRVRTLQTVRGWRVAEGLDAKTYGEQLTSLAAVAKMFEFLLDSPTEEFWCVLLNGKHRVQGITKVSQGTLNMSLVHPREVFCTAVRESAGAIIVVHNHPSGDPTPSAEDWEVTKRLRASGELLGIPVVDHVIVADQDYCSMRGGERWHTS